MQRSVATTCNPHGHGLRPLPILRLPTSKAVLTALGLFASVLITSACVTMPKPEDENRQLIRGLWSLTTQERPITLHELQTQLRLDMDHYRDDPDPLGWSRILTVGDKYPLYAKGGDPVQVLFLLGFASDKPTEQNIRLQLHSRTCVSTETVRNQIGVDFLTSYNPGVDGGSGWYEYSFVSHSGNYLKVGSVCSKEIEIVKSFD